MHPPSHAALQHSHGACLYQMGASLHFILFYGERHPQDMGAVDDEAVLNYLAVARQVGFHTEPSQGGDPIFAQASFRMKLPGSYEVIQPKRPQRLLVVLMPPEARLPWAV